MISVNTRGSPQPEFATVYYNMFVVYGARKIWVTSTTSLTYVKVYGGWVCGVFIIDVYSRMVVGSQASRSLLSDLAIDALEVAIFNRRPAEDRTGPPCRSLAGS